MVSVLFTKKGRELYHFVFFKSKLEKSHILILFEKGKRFKEAHRTTPTKLSTPNPLFEASISSLV